MILLGIETSCDETSAAVVSGGDRAAPSILSNVVLSQADIHQPYEGVVPEIAARAHLSHLDHIVARAMAEADTRFAALDGIAVAGGPGLIGGVIVGVMTAKGIAAARNLPFIAVNHLEGHALTARLTDGLDFPYLLLLVSGGHCQLLHVKGPGDYARLATTIDDAAGEVLREADVILSLDWLDVAGTIKLAGEVKAKVIQASLDYQLHNGWGMEHQGLPALDLHLAC